MDDVRGDVVEVVDGHDSGDLGHEAFDEPEVAAGDGGDHLRGFDVVGVVGLVGVPELLPVVAEDGGQVRGIERPVLVANPILLYSCG